MFQGLGCLPGTHHIQVDPSVSPRVLPTRRVPLALHSKLKKKLQELEQSSVIEKVDEPTAWVNNLVLVTKQNGDLRICLDPVYLNQAIKREHFYIPSFDEIVSKIHGAKYFSVLDASNGFWQIKLDQESSKLCTFSTPFGRYKFKRMPYGICSASEVFMKKIKELFDRIEGMDVFIDDIIIWGRTLEEHNARLERVLNLCELNNLKLNINKCKICHSSVKFMGYEISEKGLEIDNSKVLAIENIQKPKCVKDVERFLGMVNYVNRFIPNFSSITEPLRQLVRKDNLFHWDKEQETSFQSLKSCLLRAPVLQLFSTKKHITISCGSSKDGCESVLLRDNKPVAYASKAFTQTQKNYAQMEKELFAILYACTKFHYFIFGQFMNDVTIETDHKPLISIFKKPLIEAPARLQRMLIMLQPYSFRLIYKKGKELYFADTLSRAYQNNIDVQFENKCNEIEFHLCSIVENIPMTKDKFELFKTETLKDDHLMGLKNLIKRGFPSSKTLVPEEFKKYWSYRDQLAYGQDLLFKNNRIFVPLSLRKEMLKRIHLAHLGRDKTKLHARQFLFWPSMNQDIDNLIESCDICLSNSRENSKEPLEPHEILVGPWKKIGCDLFMFKNKKFLILVDYFSKFVEIKEIENETSNQIINSMYKIFSSYGIPEIVVSDGGPCFSAVETGKSDIYFRVPITLNQMGKSRDSCKQQKIL